MMLIQLSCMLLKSTSRSFHDADDIALAAGFVAIDDDNAPATENVVHPNELINNLFEDEWGHSGICYRRLTGASNCNP